MPTDRSARRVLAFALGSAAVFDITGAVIYRVLRGRMPMQVEGPPEGPFQFSANSIKDAHMEVLMRAADHSGVSFSG